MTQRDLIVAALLAPESLSSLSMMDWDLLIRQGRRASLLARLAYLLVQNGEIDTVPGDVYKRQALYRRTALPEHGRYIRGRGKDPRA